MIAQLSTSFAASVLILIATAASGVISARFLGPTGRGVLAALVLWPSVIAAVGSLGVLEATSYFSANNRVDRQSVVGASTILLAVLAIVLLALGVPLLGSVLASHGPEAVWLGRLALVGVPLTLFTTAFSVAVLGAGRTALFNVLRSVQAVVALIGACALAAAGSESVASFLMVVIAAQAANFVVATVACMAVIGPPKRPTPATIRALLTFGVKSHAGYVATVLNSQLAQLVMSMMLAATALGLYTVAVSFTTIVLVGSNAIVVTTFARLAANDAADKMELLGRSVRAALALGLAAAVPIIVAAPVVVSALFGDAYLPAVPAMRILAVGAVLLGVNGVLTAALNAFGSPLAASHAQIISLAATLILLPLLLPVVGLTGAAAASAVAGGAATIYLIRAVRRRLCCSVGALVKPRRADWVWVVAQLDTAWPPR